MPHMNLFVFNDAEIDALTSALVDWSKRSGIDIDSQRGRDAVSRAINSMNSGRASASAISDRSSGTNIR